MNYKRQHILITEKVYIFILSLFVLVVNLFLIRKQILPTTQDEVGYIANAAFILGYDWKGIMSQMPYYSYGYSLFLLPVVALTNNIISICLYINCVMVSLSLLVTDSLIKVLYPEVELRKRALVDLLVVFTPFLGVFKHYAIAECMLFFVFLCISRILISYLKKPNKINIIGLVFLSIFSFVIHQRSIVVPIAVFAVILFFNFQQEKNIRKYNRIIFFVGLAIAILVIHLIIKSYIKNNIGYVTNAHINDFDSKINMINDYINIAPQEVVERLIRSVSGKLFYFFIAYFFIPAIGLFTMVKKLKQLWKVRKEAKAEELINLFWTLIFLGAFVIAGINTIYVNRVDLVVNGRYLDYVIGPFLIIGLMKLGEGIIKLKHILMLFVITCMLLRQVLISIDKDKLFHFIEIASPGISRYFDNNIINIPLILFLPILIFFIFIYAWRAKHYGLKVAAAVLLLILWMESECYSYSIFDNKTNYEVRQEIVKVEELEILKYDSVGNELRKMATIKDKEFNRLGAETFQVAFKEIRIDYVEESIIEDYEYLLVWDYKKFEQSQKNFEVVYNGKAFKIYRKIKGVV